MLTGPMESRLPEDLKDLTKVGCMRDLPAWGVVLHAPLVDPDGNRECGREVGDHAKLPQERRTYLPSVGALDVVKHVSRINDASVGDEVCTREVCSIIEFGWTDEAACRRVAFPDMVACREMKRMNRRCVADSWL